MKNFSKELKVKPGQSVDLKDWDPNESGSLKKVEAREALAENIEALKALQYTLYAEDKRSLLIVLQGMDAAGKDGTIRSIMSGINPQGCHITSFKKPSDLELSHDYLWRIHNAAPQRGQIGIFNRSHYEDVLVVRVHNYVPKPVWSKRYDQINTFEETLAESGTKILKFFLYIDPDEQKERFQERLDNPAKNWKFNPGDLKERGYWKDYMGAFSDALEKCSTEQAPWYVIPANRKWFRNLAISSIVRETLEDMDLQMPKADFDPSQISID